jgi:glycosyltransferase involved in cell wall biosynthesis
MAVYNGERYLEEQLRSILSQLTQYDELVIVDDCSTDGSVALIRALDDTRIKLMHNPRRSGPIRTFEAALGSTTGDVIFFSDQDDVWLPTKVERTLSVFRRENASAVVTDALVVTAEGERIHDSFFAHRGSGPGALKNFYKNTYLGCCMAIDSRVKRWVLPFPRTIPQHDEWIGLVTDLVDRVHFDDTPQIAYRRHSANVTQLHRSAWLRVARLRAGMLAAVLPRLPRILTARFSLVH